MREVAARAGVSTATVSRVLNGNPTTAGELRERVLRAVDELGYRRNAVARSLRVTRTGTLGLILGDVTNPFFTELAHVVEVAARARGHDVVLGNADEDPALQDHYVRTLLERRVDGLLVVPTAGRSPLLEAAVDRGEPTVFLDRVVPGLDVPSARVDAAPAVHDLLAHLAALGHRRVGLLAGPQSTSTGRERLAAFREGARRAGLCLGDDLVREGDFQAGSGRRGAAALLDLVDPPTAIVAADNLMALGALQEVRARGLRLGSDVGLAGVDDVPWFPLLDPPVTAVAQPVAELGRAGLRLLLDVIGGTRPEPVVLPARLVVRGSCGEGVRP